MAESISSSSASQIEAGRKALEAAATDAQLVIACREGSEVAWSTLVRRYERLVLSIAQRHRLAPAAAAEVFEAVFAELWRSLAQIGRPEQVRAWLVTVARRHSLSQIHYQKRWVNLGEHETMVGSELVDPSPASDALLVQAEREQAMRVAIARMPTRCRRVLQWLFYTDPPPPYEEIGRRLGIATNSIGFVRGRCLRKLRQQFDLELTRHAETDISGPRADQ